MDRKGQISRITEMENRLCLAQKRVNALRKSLSDFEESIPEIQRLVDYYASPLWRGDYRDDEAGLLPVDLKRGVLSEDGIYDVIADIAALRTELDALRTRMQSPDVL